MKIRIIQVFFALSFVSLSACQDIRADLPQRSDCIVKVILHWPNDIASEMQEDIINKISTTIMFSAAKGGPNVHPNLSVPRDRRDLIYLQFKKNCPQRFESAFDLFNYVTEAVPAAPSFVVTRERIIPGNDAIDVWGPEWADSPEYSW